MLKHYRNVHLTCHFSRRWPSASLARAIAHISFQTGRSHILLVTTSPGKDEGAVGVVTLEDVVEVCFARSSIGSTAHASGVDREGDHRRPCSAMRSFTDSRTRPTNSSIYIGEPLCVHPRAKPELICSRVPVVRPKHRDQYVLRLRIIQDPLMRQNGKLEAYFRGPPGPTSRSARSDGEDGLIDRSSHKRSRVAHISSWPCLMHMTPVSDLMDDSGFTLAVNEIGFGRSRCRGPVPTG